MTVGRAIETIYRRCFGLRSVCTLKAIRGFWGLLPGRLSDCFAQTEYSWLYSVIDSPCMSNLLTSHPNRLWQLGYYCIDMFLPIFP